MELHKVSSNNCKRCLDYQHESATLAETVESASNDLSASIEIEYQKKCMEMIRNMRRALQE